MKTGYYDYNERIYCNILCIIRNIYVHIINYERIYILIQLFRD